MNRRHLLQALGASTALAAARPGFGARVAASPFLPVLRQPATVWIVTGDATDEAPRPMVRQGEQWTGGGAMLQVDVAATRLRLTLAAEGRSIRRLHVRWQGKTAVETRVLGDAWERSYGDLAWLPLQAERALPWYCLLATGRGTHGYGVATGAAAFAFWQVDREGISLWLDVRNGGSGVRLTGRRVVLAEVVQHEGQPAESAFAAATALCRRMAPTTPLTAERGGLPVATIFGSNDWYYAYGKNTPAGILRDAALMREMAPVTGPRPFTVIDDGYQDATVFPDMARLAEQIAAEGVVPGVWVRPLRAPATTPAAQLLPTARFGRSASDGEGWAYDPTTEDGRAATLAVMQQARQWGYRLIKHDFTTWEMFGQWGFQMGASPTRDGWSFADRSQTNAEIVSALYRDLRGAAEEDRLILGCNTVGHLAAGHFDAQRTGDDVSGEAWERTRRMGVNTLAMRLPQHGALFSLDADCVPITTKVPWALTEQWLRAVAASGTVLLVSPEPGTVGAEQKRAIREAFAAVGAAAGAPAQPQDWLDSRTPEVWRRADGAETQYEWVDAVTGASPFPL